MLDALNEFCLSSTEKNAWNVESPTWNKKLIIQTVATPAHNDVPNGHDNTGDDVSSCIELVSFSLFLFLLDVGILLTMKPTTIPAKSDAIADILITFSNEDDLE
mmetsp:Transcript_19274/g.22035  ORF Transcript_19274/g.22035 Transcript_19274/m.22035 type:complete len:104 (-) Transcript_19274:839-1150(-)